jgi:hypothetical protein
LPNGVVAGRGLSWKANAMNDPHVVALFYKIGHAEDIDYNKAPPLIHAQAEFEVRIERDHAVVRMREHYATIESGRAVIEPFFRAWELGAALRRGLGELEFKYDRAEVIDRSPVAGALQAEAGFLALTGMHVNVHHSRASYPEPPIDLARDVHVDLMFERFCRYRQGGDTLAGAAYYCLTVLQAAAQSRKEAAKHYGIAETVLDKLAILTDSKGGKDARKAKGTHAEYTPAERQWLEEVMKRIILRTAEVARDGKATFQITMAHFPAV